MANTQNDGISTNALGGDTYIIPVKFAASDGSTIDNANITTETTCSDLTIDTISVEYLASHWCVLEGTGMSRVENNLTITFSLDGYKSIVWSGKSVSIQNTISLTTLTFEKIQTLSDQITRLQTAKEDIRTALNTLAPKMVDSELSIDKYGELITNVISNSKLTIKQLTQINTETAASGFCNDAKARKQPMVVWFGGTSSNTAAGCNKLAALNWKDCYGAAFAYIGPSFNDTQFGPVDLTTAGTPSLIFIDPDFDVDAPTEGIDYQVMGGVSATNITLSTVRGGLGSLPFYTDRA